MLFYGPTLLLENACSLPRAIECSFWAIQGVWSPIEWVYANPMFESNFFFVLEMFTLSNTSYRLAVVNTYFVQVMGKSFKLKDCGFKA